MHGPAISAGKASSPGIQFPQVMMKEKFPNDLKVMFLRQKWHLMLVVVVAAVTSNFWCLYFVAMTYVVEIS